MNSRQQPASDLWRNLRRLGSSPATWAWVALILAIQGAGMLVAGPDQQPAWAWFARLGLNRDRFLDGQVWRVLSYGFLHGGGWHAGLNALFLLLIGSRIEFIAGPKILGEALIFGVLGGGLGHLLLAAGGATAPLLVGFSGACMSLLLLLTTLSPQSRMWPFPVSGKSLGLGVIFSELILALIDPALGLPGFSSLGASLADLGLGGGFSLGHACHFGGGIAGWLLGRYLLRSPLNLQDLRRARSRGELR